MCQGLTARSCDWFRFARIFLTLVGGTTGVTVAAAQDGAAPTKVEAGTEATLRAVGATSQDLSKFDEPLKTVMPKDLREFESYVTMNSKSVLRFIRMELREANDPHPSSLFADIRPTTRCGALQGMKVANATIDDAVMSAADSSCRIRAPVKHPADKTRK